jgi:glycosyltransferase involved in cell wall biosynthesis
MVSYFRKLGHDAYLITSIYHDGKEILANDLIGKKGYMLINDAELNIPIIRVSSFTTRMPPRRIVFRDQITILERIVGDFELNVLVTHSTLWNGPEEVAKFVEWRRNIKKLGGYQDPLVFCHMSHYQEPSAQRYTLVERSFRMAWNKLSLGTILRVANLILVVTPIEEAQKKAMGATKEKCILFPGGVDDGSVLNYSTSNPDELLQQLRLNHETKIITYIGTIEERKNPYAILEVAEKLRDRKKIQFIIAGSDELEYAAKIRKRAEELPNVTYLGEISEKEKVQLIEISYINILLSKLEALGITQLEFMFLGVPVITSGVGGQSWIVKSGQDGIIVNGPGDIEGAANAILELVDDTSKRQKFSVNAKKRGTMFTLTKLIEHLDDAITRELENESRMTELPAEVRSTLSEPEIIVRTWSHGTKKVAATNRRIFIQKGKLSRSTFEIAYSNINSIEHIRRYNWATLLIGTALSSLMLIHHYMFPIISRTLTSIAVSKITALLPNIRVELPQILAKIWLLPTSIALLLFLIRTRKGYEIHGPKKPSIYLPASFGETIEYIRIMQDHQIHPKNGKNTQKPIDTTMVPYC